MFKRGYFIEKLIYARDLVLPLIIIIVFSLFFFVISAAPNKALDMMKLVSNFLINDSMM